MKDLLVVFFSIRVKYSQANAKNNFRRVCKALVRYGSVYPTNPYVASRSFRHENVEQIP